MTEEVTLDSSVLVSAFVKGDVFRPAARLVMGKIFQGQYQATISTIVPVEVCGAVSKRIDENKAGSAKKLLMKWEDIGLIACSELTRKRMEEATELAIKLRMSGMDAIVVQTAKEKKRALITFDEEMAEKARGAVKVLTHKDFKKES
ncbi:hypothetical protein COZ60_01225 [Candidatus Bathyarchaeota archaeon CG_4_8_14_3_um_filter_42_8]|nr:MAG: hypothetical protein COZ60_01225 [Candidatus Bathyarchaeota archaeon CG_4_8_14_3_um_filter_42_8]